MRRLRLPFFLALSLASLPHPGHAAENASHVAPDHLTGSADEMAGWYAVSEEKWIKARELGEKILKEHPDSFAGHYILAEAMHYGEGDLARCLFHLDLGMKAFEHVFGATPATDGPWRWHEAILRDMAFVMGEMDRPDPELVILDKYDAAYAPKRLAQRVWPLMKLRRFDDSRLAARTAVASGDRQQRIIARSDLCAAECEAGDRHKAWEACTDALTDFKMAGTGGQVEYSNASESALSVFRYDEAERFLHEATQRAVPDSWGNPFQHLAALYLTETRIPEAIASLRGAQDLRLRRAAWLDQHGQARLDGTLAELFLLVGVTDRAVTAAQRGVDRPDRQGVHSGTETQAEAASEVRLAVALHEQAVRSEEDAGTAGFVEGLKKRAAGFWQRLESWRARRSAAVMLSDDSFLERSLRPYYVGGIDLPMWLMPETIDALGGGVSLAAIEHARSVENYPGSAAYFDSLKAEAEFIRGDCDSAAVTATQAGAKLATAEALLHARLSMIRGECARRRDDQSTAAVHFATVLGKDPGLFRRMELRLPVQVESDGSALGEKAASLIASSPRFRTGAGRFTVTIRSGGNQPQACLMGPNREQFACARVNLPVDTSPKVGARLLITEFHKTAFALKADLSQSDLTTLDGSPTAARADRQIKSLVDQLGGP